MPTQDALREELETYRAKFDELNAHEGRFALIHDSELGGIFDSYQDALGIGYQKYGLSPFLVRKIAAVEVAQFVTRHIAPCPA